MSLFRDIYVFYAEADNCIRVVFDGPAGMKAELLNRQISRCGLKAIRSKWPAQKETANDFGDPHSAVFSVVRGSKAAIWLL